MARRMQVKGFQHKSTERDLVDLKTWIHLLNDFFNLGGPRGTRQKKL
jgi:hypothetical protein